MKNIGFFIFFGIVLVLYSLINYYIVRRGLQVIPSDSALRYWFVVIFILLASSFVAGRFLERVSVNGFTAALIWIGSFWLAIMVYLLIQILVIDVLRSINYFSGFFPHFITANPAKTREITGIVVTLTALTVVGLGHLNTWYPKVRELNLEIYKNGGRLKTLHVVALSDIHLGTIIEKRHMAGIVKKVNALQPDVILIPGDIIDEDIGPVINSNVGEQLKSFKSKYGVYAVTGNHEYIGGVHKARNYLTGHNINLLSDTAVLLDDSFYLVGREDRTINRFTNQQRKSLKEIVSDIDASKPVILLDHQPFDLEEAQQNQVDLQLSGHTHHGQLWPFNYITKLVYELSWGYKKKGNTHYYVSSGVGGWGPPIRTVNRPEIISIKLSFNNTR